MREERQQLVKSTSILEFVLSLCHRLHNALEALALSRSGAPSLFIRTPRAIKSPW